MQRKKSPLDEGTLRQLYEVEKLTQREIAGRFGVSESCVNWRLSKYKIPRRKPHSSGAWVECQGKIKPGMHRRRPHQVIDGVESKWCWRGTHWVPIAQFSHSRNNWDGLGKLCLECLAAVGRDMYRRRDKVARYDYLKGRRKTQKARAIALFGGRCAHCKVAYDGTNGAIFDFHHRDAPRGGKEPTVRFTRSWADVERQLKGCEMLCANCHRLEHQDDE